MVVLYLSALRAFQPHLPSLLFGDDVPIVEHGVYVDHTSKSATRKEFFRISPKSGPGTVALRAVAKLRSIAASSHLLLSD